VYDRPNTRFVADFVGSSNVLDPEFAAHHGGAKAWSSLRPEKIEIASPEDRQDGSCRADGVVTSVQYQGATTRLVVDVAGTALGVVLPAGRHSPKNGERVSLRWRRDALHRLEQQ
jgi:putative spermidine/putrescine transport system ATP-binding protein